MAFDFSKQEDVAKYLENLEVEYYFGCHKEKDSEACHLLGDYQLELEFDPKKAFETFKNNCLESKYNLSCARYGAMLLEGKLCDRDVAAALPVLKSACEGFKTTGQADGYKSCYHYGAHLMDHTSGSKTENVATAAAVLDDCCTRKDQECCTQLAFEYLHGKYLPKDMNKAFEYNVKSCSLLHAPACSNVAYMYEVGNPIPKDETKAKLYRNRARNLRNPPSSGKLHFTG